MAGAAKQRAGGGARDEHHAREDERDAHDQRAGSADDLREATTESSAERPAVVLAERDHQADEPDDEAGPERAKVDEGAPDEHERSDPEQNGGHERRRRAERVVEPVGHVRADGAAVPAEPEDGREDEPDDDEPEPPELGMVVRAGLLRALLDARRRTRLARARRSGALLPRRHGLAASALDERLLREAGFRRSGTLPRIPGLRRGHTPEGAR